MENCQDSVKLVKTHIQNSASPGRAARNGYEKTFEYLDILNKRILIQQRDLVCQSKALAQMYTMGNSVLVRHEAEMPHHQPHLGDTSCTYLI